MKRQSPSADAPHQLRVSDLVSGWHTGSRSLSPSLALPSKQDYWPLLAVKLIFAATTYVAAVGFILILGHVATEWTPPATIQGLLFEFFTAVLMVFFAACLYGGGVALTCIFVIPIASWLSSKTGVIRPGRLVGGVVATIVFTPLWVLTAEREVLRVLPIGLLFTVPFILWLQAAGTLVAPGDIVQSTTRSLPRTTIGQLLIAVTLASIAAAIGSISRSVLGLVLLLTTFATLHWLGRWPTEKAGRWLLSRRFARRRRQRLAACST